MNPKSNSLFEKYKQYQKDESRLLEITRNKKISVFRFIASTGILLIIPASIFGSMLMVVWICAGIYLWFSDDDNCRTPWITNVSDWTTDIFSNKLKMKNLKENKKEREKFLKFYSLMKSDPDFKKAYLEMSK